MKHLPGLMALGPWLYPVPCNELNFFTTPVEFEANLRVLVNTQHSGSCWVLKVGCWFSAGEVSMLTFTPISYAFGGKSFSFLAYRFTLSCFQGCGDCFLSGKVLYFNFTVSVRYSTQKCEQPYAYCPMAIRASK